jgi:crotonobetainyl-CoA:carnitine CoA-transferase CaiB-like acyl-CoA transferase
MVDVMAGIRVLEIAEHTFVPASSAILADWGADVIKIEHAERGDAMRGLTTTGVMDLGEGKVHVLLEHSNRGKRSLGVDLSTAEGQAIIHRLAANCDVFLTNKTPRVRERLGLDRSSLREHNPDIIYVCGSGWGQRGPDANRGGYDVLGYWCRSGLAYGARPVELAEPPQQPAPAYGDSIGAMTIAGGICAALLHRQRTGEALDVDISLLSTGMWAGSAGIALSLQTGQPWAQREPDRIVRNPLTEMYRTSDDRWLMFSCLQAFEYWPDMCQLVERPELIADERFCNHDRLTENAPTAVALLRQEFVRRTFDEWRTRAASFRGQWSPVLTSVEIADDPQVTANGYVGHLRTKDGIPFRLITTPVQFGGEPNQPTRAPEFNEHGDEILTTELGMDWEHLIDLKVRGVIA